MSLKLVLLDINSFLLEFLSMKEGDDGLTSLSILFIVFLTRWLYRRDLWNFTSCWLRDESLLSTKRLIPLAVLLTLFSLNTFWSMAPATGSSLTEFLEVFDIMKLLVNFLDTVWAFVVAGGCMRLNGLNTSERPGRKIYLFLTDVYTSYYTSSGNLWLVRLRWCILIGVDCVMHWIRGLI